MKRIISICMAAILSMGMVFGLAHAEQEENNTAEETAAAVDTVVTGTFTQPTGYFMSEGWNVNSTDANICSLIHGYATVADTPSGRRALNTTAVKEFLVRGADDGYITHEFEIQQGLTYNDGTPITAKDYVFSLLLLSSPEVEVTGANTLIYQDLQGYDKYQEHTALTLADGSERTPALQGVRLQDDYTFSVTIRHSEEPYYYDNIAYLVQPFPISVIAPGCEVVDSEDGAYIRKIILETDEDGDGKTEKHGEEIPEDAPAYYGIFCTEMLQETIANPETGYLYHPTVTSGPYTLASYDPQTGEAEFVKNPLFKGNYEGQIPYIQHLKLCLVTIENAMQKLESGEVDLINQTTDLDVIEAGFALAQAREESEEEDVQTYSYSSYRRGGGGFLYLACEQKATDSEAVRKAIAYALDQDAFCEAYTGEYGEAIYGYYGLGQWMVQYAVENNEEAFANLQHYDLDLAKAKRLLKEDGWVYNEKGRTYNEATDTVRYRKEEDGTLTSLTLNWARVENSPAAELLDALLLPNLEELGFEINQTEMSFKEMLEEFCLPEGRQYNMYLLANNFEYTFDPSYTYNVDPIYRGAYNTSGLEDEQLMQLAVAMRTTNPDDWEGYYQKWLEFQTYWNEVLPAIPLYSNYYYDFYDSTIYNYTPNSTWTWSNAILYATLDAEQAEAIAAEQAAREAEEAAAEEAAEAARAASAEAASAEAAAETDAAPDAETETAAAGTDAAPDAVTEAAADTSVTEEDTAA